MLCALFLFCAAVVQGVHVEVTSKDNEITRFPLVQSHMYTAHVDLMGKYFSEIEVGDEIIVLENYQLTKYKVIESIGGQASDPTSLKTNIFLDGQWMTPEQVYDRVGFNDPDRLILQTCIEKDGNPIWGRMWVIAVEVH